MSITKDAIKYLQDNGVRVVDRRGKALGGNNHNRSLSGLKRGGFHWDGVSGGTIEGHERYWRNTHKWNDGGYTAFIDDAGTVFMNYDFEKRTNGVGNHNTPTLNVCYAGVYSNPMNDKQRRTAKIFWTFVVNDKRTNINSFNDIWGHNEFPGHSSNTCPGIDMNAFRNYLKDGKTETTPDIKPAPKAPKKASAEQVAQDIAVGKGGWGNNPGRDRKLKAAGYDAKAVQSRVNDIIRQREGVQSRPSPIKARTKTLHLPRGASSWRVYKPGGPYVANGKGQLKTRLAPAKFGGLSYTIKGNPAPHVYLIDTQQLGRVAIYAHPNTGAKITG